MSTLLNQRTIAAEAVFSGKALQTGHEAIVRCRPAGPDTGIVFTRTDIPGHPSVRLSGKSISRSRLRRSAVRSGRAEVQTIEHFVAALWCLGVDNIAVEINGPELPALDGSARDFLSALKRAGTAEQANQRQVIKVTEPVLVQDKGRSLGIYPDNIFSVSYLIDYPVRSIGREQYEAKLDSETFEKEIAPARTFCLKKEARILLKLGLGRGATTENTLVMDEDGPIGTSLRFPNEPVRHKVLDLVGDLYMLGAPVIGKVVAEKSGHSLNAMLVKELYERYIKKDEERRRRGNSD